MNLQPYHRFRSVTTKKTTYIMGGTLYGLWVALVFWNQITQEWNLPKSTLKANKKFLPIIYNKGVDLEESEVRLMVLQAELVGAQPNDV